MKKQLIIILLLVLLSVQFISAAELKLVKVSELKEGDVIVDRNGNEVVVQKIITQEVQQRTIGQVLNEKVYGAEEKVSNALTGFAISSQEVMTEAQPKITEKIKSFFARWFK